DLKPRCLRLLCAVVAVCIALLSDLPSLLTPCQKLFAVIEQPLCFDKNIIIFEYIVKKKISFAMKKEL
ncbi:MAG: hypothetical protein AB1325_13335, partial [Nitrospirota bacterium]